MQKVLRAMPKTAYSKLDKTLKYMKSYILLLLDKRHTKIVCSNHEKFCISVKIDNLRNLKLPTKFAAVQLSEKRAQIT